MKLIISTTEHNEINPIELPKLFTLGGKLIKNKNATEDEPIYIGEFTDIDGETVKAYSTDLIVVKNIAFMLSRYAQYDCTVEINI